MSLGWGSSVFTYGANDLRLLRACMVRNGTLSSALADFESSRAWPDGFPWRQYLEFAEHIKADRDFPEKHFAKAEASQFHAI